MADAPDLSGYSDEQLQGMLSAANSNGAPAKSSAAAPDLSGYSDTDLQAALNQSGSSKPQPKIGGLEAFGRGAEQMGALGYAPQINAEVQHLMGNGDYQGNLSKQKKSQDAAWDQHPWLYGTGAVASAIPAAAASVATDGAADAGLIGNALKSSSNLATLGAGALKGIAGAGKNAASSLVGGTGRMLEGAMTQGAIYGSSQGDTPEEKAKDAAYGAIGGKVGSKILGGVAYLGGAFGRSLYNKAFSTLAGNPTDGELGADAAHKLGITVPAGAFMHDPATIGAIKVDPFHGVPIAAASTLSQTGDKIAGLHGDVLPADAGEAVQKAADTWINGPSTNTGTSNAALDKIYGGIKGLSGNSQRVPVSNLKTVVDNAASDPDFSDAYAPTLGIVKQALSDPDGLTFDRIRALRTAVSDKMDFGSLLQDRTLNQDLLGQMRGALTKDLHSAADTIGGPGSGAAIKSADKAASGIYDTRSFLNSVIGTDPTVKSPSTVFNNLKKMASVKNGNPAVLGKIKGIATQADPDAWNQFSRGYLNNIAPSETPFTFKGFNKSWNGTSPDAKDLIFGQAGSGGPRYVLENVHTLANTGGPHIDQYGINPETQNFWQTGELLGLLMGGEGIGPKAAAATGYGAIGGKLAAQDVAKPLPPPTFRAKFLANHSNIQDALDKAQSPVPGMPSKSAVQTAKQIGIPAGADAAVKYAPVAGRLGLLGINSAANKVGSEISGALGTDDQAEHAKGGRVERKDGGKTMKRTHEQRVKRLMDLAKKAKREEDASTKPLLNIPDNAVVKALDVAQKAI